MKDIVLSHLLSQIEGAKTDLETLESRLEKPLQSKSLFEDIPWTSFRDRCNSLAVSVVSTILKYQVELKSLRGFFLNEVVEIPHLKKRATAHIKDFTNSSIISAFLCQYLCQLTTSLINYSKSNDYPDLIRSDFLYGSLPTKGDGGSPLLKGKRPVNVPDGLEVKTSRSNSITLDCHGPKIGTFLYCPWNVSNAGKVELTDMYLAFLTTSDFKKGNINSKHTTPKWNINDASKFISVLTGQLYSKAESPNIIARDFSLFDYKDAF